MSPVQGTTSTCSPTRLKPHIAGAGQLHGALPQHSGHPRRQKHHETRNSRQSNLLRDSALRDLLAVRKRLGILDLKMKENKFPGQTSLNEQTNSQPASQPPTHPRTHTCMHAHACGVTQNVHALEQLTKPGQQPGVTTTTKQARTVKHHAGPHGAPGESSRKRPCHRQ